MPARWRKVFVPAGVILALALTSYPLAGQEPQARGGEGSEPPAPATIENCKVCHQDLVRDFLRRNRHVRLGQTACENCHDSAAKHAEAADPSIAGNPGRAAPGDANQLCQACHTPSPRLNGHLSQEHLRRGAACISCHKMHPKPGPAASSHAARVNDNCSACHISQRAGFLKPHTHPLKTGAMSCADCHTPHGSQLNGVIRTPVSDSAACLRCHADKRGPFAFEHAPMRTDGCTACHAPHGSSNPRMLTRPNVATLCLECHSSITAAPGALPPAFHDLRSARFRNCTTCHQKIHGSYADRGLLR